MRRQRDVSTSTSATTTLYGSPRVTEVLARRGYCVNHKRVESLMAAYGLYACDGRRKRSARRLCPAAARPGGPGLLRRGSRRAVLRGHHLRGDRGGLALRGRRRRHRLSSHRRLRHGRAHAHRTGGRRLGHGHRRSRRRGRRHDLQHGRGAQYMSREFRERASTMASPRRPVARGRTSTTLWPRACGRPSSASSSAAASPRGRRLAGPSSPGSTAMNAVRRRQLCLGGVPPIEWELRHYRSTAARRSEAA